MTGGIFGGGVIFVVAAILWAAVLVPSWMRRREFRAAERNALRLQRTLRVLAESAEVPTEVQVEATAREALAQERLLRAAQQRQEAERKAQLAEVRAAKVRAEIRAQQVRRKQAAMVRAAKLRRPWVRRVRATAALAAVLTLAGVLIGAGVAAVGQGFTVLLASLAAFAASTGALVLLAPGRVRIVDIPAETQAPASASRVAQAEATDADHGAEAARAAHLAAQAAARAQIERARALARARAEASAPLRNRPDSIFLEAVRDGAAPSETARVPVEPAMDTTRASSAAGRNTESARRSATTAAASTAARLSQMGVIGDTSEGRLDLDAALRARRNAS